MPWRHEVNWLCLPVHLIPSMLGRQQLKVRTRIALSSPYVSFWPLLFPDGVQPAHFIQELQELPLMKGLTLSQRSGAALFKGIPNIKVLAIFIKFEGLHNALALSDGHEG